MRKLSEQDGAALTVLFGRNVRRRRMELAVVSPQRGAEKWVHSVLMPPVTSPLGKSRESAGNCIPASD